MLWNSRSVGLQQQVKLIDKSVGGIGQKGVLSQAGETLNPNFCSS